MKFAKLPGPLFTTLLFFAIFFTHLAVGWARAADDLLLTMGNDSAMRLAQVRDLLAGQPWRDLHQHRLGLPSHSVEMHWSRIVDAILAAKILLSKLFTTPEGAERAALILWPSLWFSVAICSSTVAGYLLAGRYGALYTFALFGATNILNAHFQPGNIDHHNIQIALLALSVSGFLGRHRSSVFPIISAAAVAVSIHIGSEILPLMALVTLAYAITWANDNNLNRPVSCFFATLIAATLLIFATTVPYSAYRGGFCDAPSLDLVLPVVLFSGIMCFANIFHLNTSTRRTLYLSAAAASTLFLTILFFPACLSNPLTELPADLNQYWLSHVSEARSLAEYTVSSDRPYSAGFWVLGVISIVASSLMLTNNEKRTDLILLIFVSLILLIATAYQIRFVIFLMITTPIMLGYAASTLKKQERAGVLKWGGVQAMLLVLIAVPQTWMVAHSYFLSADGTAADRLAGHSECVTDRAFQELAELPPGLVSTTSNLGAHVLLHTPHATLSAPYHRNVAGMLNQLKIALAQSAEDAENLLLDAGVDYIVLCTEDPEIKIVRRSNQATSWMERVLTEGAKISNFKLHTHSETLAIYKRDQTSP